MRADYDSQGDTLQITLVDVDHADYGDDAVPGAIVAIRNGGPVAIDVLNARQGTEQPLQAVAERYGLDIEALTAAARAALAGPDRTVIIDLLARAAA
jgi:hypothetical protein